MNYLETSRFTPSHRIEEVVRENFPTSTVIHKFTDSHIVCKFTVEDLLKSRVANWEFNRPPDHTRCRDIAHYLYNSKRQVDTMFHMSFNNLTRNFDILDGIHRYTALKYLREQNGGSTDYIDSGYFGSNLDATWLYTQRIIVNIRFNALESDLIETFKSLNKSNPVPDLYIRDVAKEKRDLIEIIVLKWQTKYPTHFSSSSSPNKPNCNRDKFIGFLDEVYDKFADPMNDLESSLTQCNNFVKSNVPKTSASILKKCDESGCYLFLHKLDKLAKIVV
jgi:hypothetical protein